MSDWVIWLIAAIVFLLAEMATTTLFVIPFSVGALAGMLAGLVGAPVVAQLLIFLAVSGVAFTIVRPIARRHRNMPPQIRSGTAALIGRGATVLDEVTRESGTVKLEGEVWSARPIDEDEVYAPGTRVQVIQIQGATALVSD
jgi:membrane protein implicated in regulation of membrane protease activity